MLAHLLDIKKTIVISLLVAITTAAFLFNIYLFTGLLLLGIASIRFGIRDVVIIFTISTYLLVTSDLSESLRNIINISNIILLALLFIYYKGIDKKNYILLPNGFNLFIISIITSFILSSLTSEYISISINTMIRQLLFFTICFIYYSFVNTKRDIYLLIYTLISISIILGIGIVYQLFTKGIGVYYLESMDAIRFSGLYNNPNAVGLFLVVSIPLLFSFLFNREVVNSSIKKIVLFTVITFMLFCLIITNSRASIIGVILSLGYILFIFRRKMLLRVLSVFMALCLIVLLIPIVQEYFLFYVRADRVFSNTRSYFWSVAIDIIINNPIFGAGPGVFEEYIYKYLPVSLGSFFEHQMYMASSGTAHNFFLFRTADLGVLGLITSVWLFVLFFLYSNKSIKYFNGKNPGYYLFSVTVKSIGLGLLIRAFFESTGIMTHGWITRDLPFWLVFIILISIYQKVPKTEIKI